MQRLAQFDVSRQFVTRPGQIAAQIVFGAVCAAAMIGVRAAVDLFAPVSGPFALIYPTVLLATLYGHWRAGVIAFVVTFLWAWYFVLPAQGSFLFTEASDPARVVINAIAALIVLIFAEAFRRVARSTVEEIRQSADRRLAQLAELEHRTKNNFALVASLLEIQKRRVSDTALHPMLDDAAGRVRTFADAYSSLSIEHSDGEDVDMRPYLDQLLDRIERAAVPDHVSLFREMDAVQLSRETAVAIGLYLNEAISNSLKYAFPDERPGKIGVFFQHRPEGWRLTIDDNGVGIEGEPSKGGGLGSNLLQAFSAQAGARHSAGPTLGGFRTEMNALREAVA